eukprot:SAG11_NODE_907_length_6599_cov_13.219231_1_plen_502_part_00
MCGQMPGGGCEEGTGPGKEAVDMAFFADAGCDHVMVDMPDGATTSAAYRARYAAVGAAIRNLSNKDMMFSVWCAMFGYGYKWASAVGGTYWRIGDDLYDGWQSIMRMWDTLQSIPLLSLRTNPGAYTFLDPLVVGDVPDRAGSVHGPGLSYDESVAQMTLWTMAASPLLASIDVRNMSAATQEIYTNPELLTIHKDPLCKMALRVDVGGAHVSEAENANFCPEDYPDCQRLGPKDPGYNGPCKVCHTNSSVWEKPLADNSSAVMVLNRGEQPVRVAVLMYDLGDNTHDTFAVRDIWARADLSIWTGSLSVAVPAHGVRLLRMTPHPPPPPHPPSPPHPPPPHPPCPAGFSSHASGFWEVGGRPPSQPMLNATVEECAAKCAKDDAAAFEVFLSSAAGRGECYTFLSTAAPFKANPECVTCVRKKLGATLKSDDVDVARELTLAVPQKSDDTLRPPALVPHGSTNLRISVFPATLKSDDSVLHETVGARAVAALEFQVFLGR